MLIPCEECKKKISSEAKQCPHCGHPMTEDWREVYIPRKKAGEEWKRMPVHPNEAGIGRPMLILLFAILLIVGLFTLSEDFSSAPSSGENAAQRVEPRDPDAVPFGRTWKSISAAMRLSPDLAQTLAKKVRAEGHHCGDIYSYQNPESGKYFLLCDGLAYVYELKMSDDGWAVTPDIQNPDQNDTRTVEEKAKDAGEAVRETSKGRKYRVSEFVLDDKIGETTREHWLGILDILVGALHSDGEECDRVIFMRVRQGVASVTCAEEYKPSMEYNFNLKEALGF